MPVEVVGRDDELAILRSFVEAVGEGPSALVLDGAAGIGKTTLWRAGVDVARSAGLLVLTATPAEAERELANVVLGDLLVESLATVLPRLPAPRRHALEAALLLDAGHGAEAGPRELGVAVHSAVRLLAEEHPLVIAVDDVQWVDVSSAGALAFALRRLADAPVAWLLARRTGLALAADLEAALAGQSVTRLRVQPLTLGATQALIRSRAGRSFARPLLVRLHEVSGGNPFYALELARAVDETGAAQPGGALPLPETLESLVGDRIRALPDSTRAAVLVLAALGRATRNEVADAGVLFDDLTPALGARVVEIAGDDLFFTHPLLASAAYALALPEDRRSVHARLAETAADPVSRARHLAVVVDAVDAESAAALEAAADVTRARGAPAAAAELGEVAARVTPPGHRVDARRRTERAARDHFAAGGVERAFALGGELLEASATRGERGEALVLVADLEDWAGDLSRAASHFRDALGCLGDAPHLHARAREGLAFLLRDLGTIQEAEHHARQALREAEELADTALTSAALGTLATIRFSLGEPDAYALARRAAGLLSGLPPGNGARLVVPKHVVHPLAWSGRIDEARRVATEHLPLVAEYDEREAAYLHWYLSLVETRAGRLQLAREHAESQRRVLLDYSPPEIADDPVIAVAVAHVAVYQGDDTRARELAERGVVYANTHGLPLHAAMLVALLGMLDHWSGNSARAVERFDAYAGARRGAGQAHTTTAVHVADHVEALLALGRLSAAEAMVSGWETETRKLDDVWAGPQIVRSRGLVAAARGEVDKALGRLEEAVSLHESIGDPFGRGRALLALGATRRRARQKRAAREASEEALGGFEEMGAVGWAQKARAELGRIGGRTRAEDLTPAERRVAALAAEGRTNREVAAALFLGERTVETHLSHVYAKLGIRSRTELARVLR